MSTQTARIRPFATADYAALVDASNRTFPDYPWSVEEMRHYDENFDTSRFFKIRLVAEEDGAIVGAAEGGHRPSRFDPDSYHFDLWVVPERRRQGHGSALHDAVIAALRARSGRVARGATKESLTDGMSFLQKRGWKELKRDWESRLTVAGFDVAKFAGADERVAKEGIRISTYADELARDPETPQKAFELIDVCRRDVPATDAATPITFEEWRAHWVDAPGFLPDAFFVAIDRDGRWLGVSNMQESSEGKAFIWQGFTGVRREARGKGIAMALKLRTVRRAQELGVDHIKTWNDQSNRPMLAINEAMGFEKQPAWISFEYRLRP
ncbi:MAG TPA: GNAT family N-acetyltransferase [Candidatus Limnocylindria bacterium]|nr:GNAT family N-acetyltransferase [Candidatus Limnocylindria bacterium]